MTEWPSCFIENPEWGMLRNSQYLQQRTALSCKTRIAYENIVCSNFESCMFIFSM